eukprot:scaffold19725_cov70-Phaeocystis_antarctica.AAC.2
MSRASCAMLWRSAVVSCSTASSPGMSSTMCAFADAAEQSSNGWHTALGCPVTATSRPFDERSPNISGGKKDGGHIISQCPPRYHRRWSCTFWRRRD